MRWLCLWVLFLPLYGTTQYFVAGYEQKSQVDFSQLKFDSMPPVIFGLPGFPYAVFELQDEAHQTHTIIRSLQKKRTRDL